MFHFVAVTSLAAKLIVTEQNIMPKWWQTASEHLQVIRNKGRSSRNCGMFHIQDSK